MKSLFCSALLGGEKTAGDSTHMVCRVEPRLFVVSPTKLGLVLCSYCHAAGAALGEESEGALMAAGADGGDDGGGEPDHGLERRSHYSRILRADPSSFSRILRGQSSSFSRILRGNGRSNSFSRILRGNPAGFSRIMRASPSSFSRILR